MRVTRRAAWILAAACIVLGACRDETLVGDEPQEVKRPGDLQAAGTCSPEYQMPSRGNPISCCQDHNRIWQTLDGKRLAFRTVANPCTEADGVSTNCVGTGCVYGPCGAKIDWTVDATEVHIFEPSSKPGTCGWAVKGVKACTTRCDFDRGWPLGVDRDHPEPYSGQDEYPGVIATCPYTSCPGAGVPGL